MLHHEIQSLNTLISLSHIHCIYNKNSPYSMFFIMRIDHRDVVWTPVLCRLGNESDFPWVTSVSVIGIRQTSTMAVVIITFMPFQSSQGASTKLIASPVITQVVSRNFFPSYTVGKSRLLCYIDLQILPAA